MIKGTRLFCTAKKEYKSSTSFFGHIRKTQKPTVINLGMALLTLSLASQIVNFKIKQTELIKQNEIITKKYEELLTKVENNVSPIENVVMEENKNEITNHITPKKILI